MTVALQQQPAPPLPKGPFEVESLPGPVTWVTRGFLDYRVPVFAALNRLLQGRLRLIYSQEATPPRVQQAVERLLGHQAIGLAGEKQWGDPGRTRFANSRVFIPFQPGLYRAIAATRPAVLIADGFFRWTPAAVAYRLRHRKRLVICYEKTRYTERQAQWYRTLYRRLVVRVADAICCSGQLCREYASDLGIPSGRVNCGHMVADVDAIERRAAAISSGTIADLRRALGVEGCCLMYVGRLISLKGLSQLLDAWQRLEVARPRAATLVIVGDGPLQEQLRQRASQLELTNVRFVGRVEHEQIVRYYAAADALVMPTLEDNWSLVVPEAMACGLPVLSSRFNGCWPELVRPDENGWLFDPYDAAGFAKCLGEVCSRVGELPAMGQRSRAIVRNHTPQTAARAVWAACQLALSDKNQFSACEI